METIVPPPFPLESFKNFLTNVIGISPVYKTYNDTFLRQDAQDMYLGAKWVWLRLTANFEKDVLLQSHAMVFKRLSTSVLPYTPERLENLKKVTREAVTAKLSNDLLDIFNVPVPLSDETDFRNKSRIPVGGRGNGKTFLHQAVNQEHLKFLIQEAATQVEFPYNLPWVVSGADILAYIRK